LKKCLESLFTQTLNDFEILLIINENSSEIPVDYLKKIEHKINIKIIKQPQLSPNNIQGEYIHFINSNDWLEDNCLERLYKNILLYDPDIMIFDYYDYANDNLIKEKKYNSNLNESNETFNLEDNTALLFNKPHYLWSKIYKNKFLKENNIEYPNYELINTLKFNIETLLLAKKISYTHENLYYHRIRDLDKINDYNKFFDEFKDIKKILMKNNYYSKMEPELLIFKLKFFEKHLLNLDYKNQEIFLKLIKRDLLNMEYNKSIIKTIPFNQYQFFIHVINSKSYEEFNLTHNKKTNPPNYLINEINETDEIKCKILNDLNSENYTNIKAFKKIKELGLFDEKFYRNEYSYFSNIDPVLHYIYKGCNELRNPNPIFDGKFYSESNENVKKSYLDPFIYFILYGLDEGKIKINENAPQPGGIINKEFLDNEILNFNKLGVDKNKQPNIIVSLTSFPERMNDIHYVLYSLLTQDFKPTSVILWLANSQFPHREKDIPQKVLSLKENGLEIKWFEDIVSFKKLIPALIEYPNDIIVTADDDIYYPKHWLKELWHTHLKYPNDIISHRARKITLNSNSINKYSEWELCLGESESSYLNFATNGAGSLIPPNSYDKRIFNYNLAKELCSSTDDVWFWAMSVLNRTKTHVVKNNMPWLTYVNPARDFNILNQKTLWGINEHGVNDKNIKKIIKEFPEILELIING